MKESFPVWRAAIVLRSFRGRIQRDHRLPIRQGRFSWGQCAETCAKWMTTLVADERDRKPRRREGVWKSARIETTTCLRKCAGKVSSAWISRSYVETRRLGMPERSGARVRTGFRMRVILETSKLRFVANRRRLDPPGGVRTFVQSARREYLRLLRSSAAPWERMHMTSWDLCFRAIVRTSMKLRNEWGRCARRLSDTFEARRYVVETSGSGIVQLRHLDRDLKERPC